MIDTVAIEIIEKCNLTCSFCTRNANYKLKSSINLYDFLNVTNKLRKDFRGIKHLAISGGEPFLNKDLNKIVEISSLLFEVVSITTNGTIYKKDLIDLVASRNNIQLIISIDSHISYRHDEIRGKGAFLRTFNFLKQLEDRNIPYLVNMTVTDFNIDDMIPMVKWLSSFSKNLMDISLSLAKPNGRASQDVVSEKTLSKYLVFSELLRYEEYDFTINTPEPLIGLLRENYHWGCGAKSSSLHMQTNGTFLNCTSNDKSSIGHFSDKDINKKALIKKKLELVSNINCRMCDFYENCNGCSCRSSHLGYDYLCPNINKSDNIDVNNINADLYNRIPDTKSNFAGLISFDIEHYISNRYEILEYLSIRDFLLFYRSKNLLIFEVL